MTGSLRCSSRQSVTRLGVIGWVGLCAAGAALSGLVVGNAWADSGTHSGATAALQVQSMHLLTANSGWVAGSKNLLWTKDAGQHWTDITPPSRNAGAIGSVFFLDELQGWVVQSTARGSEVSRTSDGGVSWASQPLVTSNAAGGTPKSIDFVDARHGWMLLQMPSSSNFSLGSLLTTADGGISWTSLPQPPSGKEVRFVSTSTGWQTGGAAGDPLYMTQDGGHSWQQQSVSVTNVGTTTSYQLPTFRTQHDGSLAVFSSGPGGAQLTTYGTHDGGLSWSAGTSVPVDASAGAAGGVVASVVDANTVFVAPRSRAGFTAVVHGVPSSQPQFFNKLSPTQAVTALDFNEDRQGWVLVAAGHCDSGKSQCRQETTLFATSDDGQTLHDITPALAQGAIPQAVVTSTGTKGFDQCAAGTVSQMQAWWSNTPWSFANMYIGGSNRGCGQANLSSGWVNSTLAQGWKLVPTWVGLQAPTSSCSSCGKMSTNNTTARQQGINEADAATSAANALGLTAPTVIYYDMEQYNGASAAVKAFVGGWSAELHNKGNKAGVYGNGSNAASDWATAPTPPDAVWIANWNGSTSVFGLSGLPDSEWSSHQRLHQYEGGHNETWGGVTFNIDSNSADGPVASH